MPDVPVSVVIPAYNSERFIRDALESVLAQTLSVDEIIVVDNNCTDRTIEIAEELGARVVRESKQNLAAARNRGIGVCRNEWIAFLDSDDLWEKEKIELQWQAIEAFPSARIITCESYMLIDSNGAKIPPQKMPVPHSLESKSVSGTDHFYCAQVVVEIFNWLRINASSVIYNRDVFAEIGNFDETLLHVEAVEFFMRSFAGFPLALVKKCLVSIRRHDRNRTLDRAIMDKYYILTTEKIAESPAKYPPGTLDYFRRIVNMRFISRARQLAKKEHLPGE